MCCSINSAAGVYYLHIENAEGYVSNRRVFIYLYACWSHNSKSIKPNRMTFGGMIGYYPGTIWFNFGIDWVKGQGHEKVKKSYFYHSTVNFYPIGMQLMPTCS